SLDGHLTTILRLYQASNLVTQVGIVTGQSDDHVGAGTEVLHDGIFPATVLQHTAHFTQISRLAVIQLDQRAAGEVQSEIQLLDCQRADGTDHEDSCKDVGRLAQPHEVDSSDIDHDLLLTAIASRTS